MNLKEYFELGAFSLNKDKKKYYFKKFLQQLTLHHYKKSKEYKNILKHLNYNLKNEEIEKIPFLPVNLFKNMKLKSISDKDVFKILRSSGTSKNELSQIYLDKKNSNDQRKILSKIVSTILGKKRIPMLMIDTKPSLKDRSNFNAKIAAFFGFSIFGTNHTFALNPDGSIAYDVINKFLDEYGKSNFFVFGFTNQVYENLFLNLKTNLLNHNFSNGILIHGGGWKKMINIKVNNEKFKKNLFNKIKLSKVFNYYGLVEQTGSIFIECEKCSSLVTSIFSDIIIRDQNFNVQINGKKGFIQVISLLPSSYPGHSLLTEDIGEIVSNNCDCSTIGKRFKIYGRIKNAEIRGCSDI